MTKSSLIPAAGYLRRSTNLQPQSIPDQKRDILKWAKENGYRIIRWYSDDAISGTSTKKRQDFSASAPMETAMPMPRRDSSK